MDMIPVILLLIPALYFFAVWPRTSRKEQMQRYEHTLFAHRGYHCASQGIPENSMSAFRAAISQGYGIELDVHLTLDGKLAVFHDDDLLRVCGSKDSIENLTYKELERYRLFDTKEHIPLFTDVLSLVNGQVPLLIEMKIPSSATDICSVLCETLKSYHGPYLVQSFNTMGLRWFRLHAPEVLRGQLSDNLTKRKAESRGFCGLWYAISSQIFLEGRTSSPISLQISRISAYLSSALWPIPLLLCGRSGQKPPLRKESAATTCRFLKNKMKIINK